MFQYFSTLFLSVIFCSLSAQVPTFSEKDSAMLNLNASLNFKQDSLFLDSINIFQVKLKNEITQGYIIYQHKGEIIKISETYFVANKDSISVPIQLLSRSYTKTYFFDDEKIVKVHHYCREPMERMGSCGGLETTIEDYYTKGKYYKSYRYENIIYGCSCIFLHTIISPKEIYLLRKKIKSSLK